jgi:hypothetical protein
MANQLWMRLETSIFDHPKMLYLSEAGEFRAIVLHLKAMTYSARHGLNGFIPEVCLRMLAGGSDDAYNNAKHDAETLLDAALWMPAPGGWTCNGWEEFQGISEEARERSEHARRAAQARWAKRNGRVI